MGKEIERKFLMVKPLPFPYTNPQKIRQAYIFAEKGKHVRIRLYHDKAVLGLKYTTGPVRDEFEYEIPMKEGLEIYKKCRSKLEKVRFSFDKGKEHYDIDTFPNKVEFVEVEFKSIKDAKNWVKPDWIGKEITGVSKYSNIVLAKKNLIF